MTRQTNRPSLLDRIGRVLLCQIFIHAVIARLTGFGAEADAVATLGIPMAPVFVVVAIVLMIVGSVLVISGRKAWLGAILLLSYVIPVTLMHHGDWNNTQDRIELLKNLAIIGALLLVIDRHPPAIRMRREG